jgi:penicillin amidase
MGKVKILNKVLGLNRGPFPVGGSFHTIAPFSYRVNQLYIASSGASQRHIYSLADWDQSVSIIPSGNSGNPSSKHYCDQTMWYLKGKYHPDMFTRTLIENKYRYYAVFTP